MPSMDKMLLQIANLLTLFARELSPPDEGDRLPPPSQYPVGTLLYRHNGQVWQVKANGRWQAVEQDGEPLDPWQPDPRCLNDAYCDCCEQEDDDQ